MIDSPTPSSVQRPFRIRPSYVIALLLVLAAITVMVTFFERIPIEGTMLAIDWQGLYAGLQGGHIVYGSLLIAPWSLPAVLPLGFFSMRAGWGLLALYTLTILMVSVPRRRNQIAAIFLLVTSFPALRQLVDGNFEALVIAGAALVVYGFRRNHMLAVVAGLLLATTKPQETWVLMIVFGVYLLRSWSLQRIFELAMSLAVVIVPSLILFGAIWFSAMGGMKPPPGSLLDTTLWAAMGRLGIPDVIRQVVRAGFLAITLFVGLRANATLTREKAGMLIMASLLLAPYAAGNSFLTPLAIGIIPTWQSQRRLGWVMLALTDVQYLMPHEFMYWNGAYYTTAVMIFIWAIWCWQIYRTEVAKPSINEALGNASNN